MDPYQDLLLSKTTISSLLTSSHPSTFWEQHISLDATGPNTQITKNMECLKDRF